MKVVDKIAMLKAQIEDIETRYCGQCQEWSCEDCGADMREEKEDASDKG